MTAMQNDEFSYKTRQKALTRFQQETFDLLIIGGGITGAATARDAMTRGLKVALVEKHDFAWGTSSRSSKLIHGGLRYLESMEFRLVFEALAERAHLLKVTPYRVRPLRFYVPNYRKDKKGRLLIGIGLWLYDILSLFRSPHKHLSKKRLLEEIPHLKQDGLKGGYRYLDASMWDDLLVVDTVRAAALGGSAVANYMEAVSPLWNGDTIEGFKVRDRIFGNELEIKAKRVIVCGGPWTDELGAKLSPTWKPWLKPSKGVHLVFDSKRLPMPGAMVMVHPEDGRVSFVIGRPDFASGVTIVGTTDGPTDRDPEKAAVDQNDVEYLMGLLQRYFPDLNLTKADILSAYVGVRPLMGDNPETNHQENAGKSLQNVSREHYIGQGPGKVVLVAGGKYTTHRQMAAEIVDFTLKAWQTSVAAGGPDAMPAVGPSKTELPANPNATSSMVAQCLEKATAQGLHIPFELIERYGADALSIMELARPEDDVEGDPPGFPYLAAQLRYAIRYEMVMHLEDFFLRRVPLFLARADSGLPWAQKLSRVWAEETCSSEVEAAEEVAHLKAEVEKRSFWKNEPPSISSRERLSLVFPSDQFCSAGSGQN